MYVNCPVFTQKTGFHILVPSFTYLCKLNYWRYHNADILCRKSTYNVVKNWIFFFWNSTSLQSWSIKITVKKHGRIILLCTLFPQMYFKFLFLCVSHRLSDGKISFIKYVLLSVKFNCNQSIYFHLLIRGYTSWCTYWCDRNTWQIKKIWY